MYRPDRRIVRYLQEYDRELNVRWDSPSQRWELTWKGKPVARITEPDGSYRPLDERVVTQVALMDAVRVGDASRLAKEVEEHNHRLTDQQRARFSDLVQQVAKEDLYRAFFGSKPVTPGIAL